MFRKALITIAAAVSMSSAAFAQFNPNEPAYIRANGPQAAAEYNRDDDGYAPQGNGYSPQSQNGPQAGGYGPQGGGYGPQSGGYGPQGAPQGGYGSQNGGYGPQSGGYGPQGQGGYALQQQQPQQPAPSSIDMRSVTPGQSQQYRYMMPQGWRPMETSGMCLVASPDMTMAYGVMAPGMMQGNLSADAYMRETLTGVAQFQNIQILSGQRGQARAPFTESGTFVVNYTAGGQQYLALINCAVAQGPNGTYGFMQVIFGTHQAIQQNSQSLMQLMQTVKPMNPPQGAPTNNGPVNNGPVNGGPVNSGPVNNGPVNNGPNYGPANNAPVMNGSTNATPTYRPTSNPNASGNGGPINPLER